MKKPSEEPQDWDSQRNRIIGLGETSIRKSYYPELQQRIHELELKNEELNAAYEEETAIEEQLRNQFEQTIAKEKELRESEAFLTSIVENLPLMLCVKNTSDLRFVRFNKAGEDLLGFSREDLIGKNDHDLFPKEQADSFSENDRDVLKSRTPFDIPEEKIETRTHGERILHTRKIPILNSNGEPRFLLCISEDITERRRAEEALEKRLVALTQPIESTAIAFEELFDISEIQRIQDEFAKTMGVGSVITHTDGTPITTPSNFTRLCNDIIRKSARGCENCYKSDAILGSPRTDGPIVQPCLSGGLWDAGTSIVVGGQHIANWLIGQVRNEAQTEEAMRAYAHEIGVDEQTVLEAFREVPSMSYEKFHAIAQLLFIFANQLSKSAYQNVQQARFITDRKHAVEALRTSEERYRSLVDITDTGYLVLDNKGLVVDANGVYVRFTGRESVNDLLGHPMTDWTAPHDLERATREIEKCLTTGRIRGLEIDYIRPDGTIQPIEINATIFHTGAGDVVLTLCRDISERKRTDIALHQARNKLNLLNAVTFQDIQTAAVSLAAYQELVKTIILDQKAKSYLEKQEIFLKKMVDTLDFAKNYQEMGIHPSRWQNVRQVFLYAISHLDYLHIRQNLQLQNLEVFADPLFEKALFNIMQNVIKHGVRATEVTLRYVEHPESLVLIIEDNGVGIPAEEKHMIFDRGYGKGSGLGLFLVREILSITGMSIREAGISGQGTRFEITIPKGTFRLG
ncbi:MAG: PocR ligand-binding domain-containing protein [Methanoregula sp.]|jgi:PAS domain S-box-containing protein|nr:PocR ligand-binding domain-containing protein [Methanoregula sp.]